MWAVCEAVLLLQGTYASLGLARTSEQWRNYGIAAGAALLLTSGYWMYRRLGDVRVRHRQVRCLSAGAQQTGQTLAAGRV